MKTLIIAAAAAIGMTGAALAGETKSKALIMTDYELDQIVAGKKPGVGGNAIEYTKADGSSVYVDSDYNGNVSKNWSYVGPCTYQGGGVCN